MLFCRNCPINPRWRRTRLIRTPNSHELWSIDLSEDKCVLNGNRETFGPIRRDVLCVLWKVGEKKSYRWNNTCRPGRRRHSSRFGFARLQRFRDNGKQSTRKQTKIKTNRSVYDSKTRVTHRCVKPDVRLVRTFRYIRGQCETYGRYGIYVIRESKNVRGTGVYDRMTSTLHARSRINFSSSFCKKNLYIRIINLHSCNRNENSNLARILNHRSSVLYAT